MKLNVLFTAAMLAVAPIDGLADEGRMPPFAGATGWLNSPPLTAAELRGKVVLVDFWTYTCINWLRTLPYVRAWAEKYRDHGLVVIGVHTPEFEFEKNAGQRPARGARDARHLSGCDRQRLCRLARVQQQRLAGDLSSSMRRAAFATATWAKATTPQTERMIQQLLAEAGNAAGGRATW